MTQPPERIGPWLVERILGRGAMATVYLCRGESGEAAAVKWLDSEDGPAAHRFATEQEALARLRHPSIVRRLGVGLHQGRPWLAMEYVDGPDLRVHAEKLRARPPAERYSRCRAVGLALCEALQVIHDQGYVHRDVKPANVLIDSSGRVVLSDFGVVSHPDALLRTEVGTVIGTPAFAAPEQLRGDDVGPAADLFGLGATLYFLLTARRPFEGLTRDPSALPTAVSRIDPGVPAHLEALVLRLMAPDPADRHASVAAAHAALAQLPAVGTPLAGRQKLLDQVAAVLDEASAALPMVVGVTGARGTGKAWLVDTLRNGAQRRGIPVLDVLEEGAAQAAGERLTRGDNLLVVSTLEFAVPPGVPRRQICLYPLGPADIRRSVVAAAPLTRDPSRVADRLHRLTGGLAILLVPLLERYVVGGSVVVPEGVVLADVTDPLLDELDLDESEVLGAIAALGGQASLARVEALAMVPVEPHVARLVDLGLVVPTGGGVRLAAQLYMEASLQRHPDRDGLVERALALEPEHLDVPLSARLARGLAEAERAAAEAPPALALAAAREVLRDATALDEPAVLARATRHLGQVLLDCGQLTEARAVLADASALARAGDLDDERRLCHALRARADLDRNPGARQGAAAAMDRLLPLLAGAGGRPPDQADALIFAAWGRAAGVVGDRPTALRAAAEATGKAAALGASLRARVALERARALHSLGQPEDAAQCLDEVDVHGLGPLLTWELSAVRARSRGFPIPALGSLADGLSADARDALDRVAFI